MRKWIGKLLLGLAVAIPLASLAPLAAQAEHRDGCYYRYYNGPYYYRDHRPYRYYARPDYYRGRHWRYHERGAYGTPRFHYHDDGP